MCIRDRFRALRAARARPRNGFIKGGGGKLKVQPPNHPLGASRRGARAVAHKNGWLGGGSGRLARCNFPPCLGHA
eukprot:12583763-Alexandrium_andersonii.AAC.1